MEQSWFRHVFLKLSTHFLKTKRACTTGCFLQWEQYSLCNCSHRSCPSTVGITALHWPERISGQFLQSQGAQRFGRLIDLPLRINWAVCSEVVSAPCYTYISSCECSFRLTGAKSYVNGSPGENPHAGN